MTVTIDRAGRLVIPKKLRDRFHLAPGTVLRIEARGDGIQLSLVRAEPSLIRKAGILVHHGTEVAEADTVEVIEQERRNRTAELLETIARAEE